MRFLQVFRSGNTMRVTIPRTVRHALKLQPGDTVSMDNVRDGVIELRSVRYDRERKLKGKNKS